MNFKDEKKIQKMNIKKSTMLSTTLKLVDTIVISATNSNSLKLPLTVFWWVGIPIIE